MLLFIAYFLFILSHILTADDQFILENAKKMDILKVMNSLDKALDYYEKNLNSFNFDGAFGLAAVKNLISDTYNYVPNNHLNKFSVFLRMNMLYENIERYLLQVHANFKETDDLLYKLLKVNWSPDPQRMLNRDEVFNLTSSEGVTEEFTDHCLRNVLGIYDKNCLVSSICLSYLNKNVYTGYDLTHQIIVIRLIKQSPCAYEINEQLNKNAKSFDEMETEMCSKSFQEANRLLKHPRNFAFDVELGLEHVFVCYINGFVEFMDLPFLDSLIALQYDNGCFSPKRKRFPNRRRLLMIKFHTDNCESHLTSLSIIALAVALNYFARSVANYPEQFLKDEFSEQKSFNRLMTDSMRRQSLKKLSKLSEYNESMWPRGVLDDTTSTSNLINLFQLMWIVIFFILLLTLSRWVCRSVKRIF